MSWKKYLRITFFIHKVAGLLCKVVGMKWDNIYKWAEWIVYKEKVWLFISWLHNRHYCVKESAPMTSKIHRCSFLSQLTAYPFSFLGFFFSCLELPDSFSSFSLIMLASFLTWHSFSVWSFWWFPINIRIVTPTLVAHDSLETMFVYLSGSTVTCENHQNRKQVSSLTAYLSVKLYSQHLWHVYFIQNPC